MKIYRRLDDFKPVDVPVVTIGTFDGVHLGHQKILQHLKSSAQKVNGETVLLTFFPHPRLIINPDDNNLKLINDIEEKVNRLSKVGIDHLIIIPFSRDFSNQLPEEYISNVLIGKLGMKKMVIGYDHRFGKDRKGDFHILEEYAPIFEYTVDEIDSQDINDVVISSTRIREALIKGDIKTANSYLGYPFELTGTVVKGDQIGRTIGFPTANLHIHEPHKLIPAYGIYAVEVEIFDTVDTICTGEYREPKPIAKAQGMGYIGNRPTVDGIHRTIEISLFDFKDDIYEKSLRVKFLHFVRHDEKFESLEQLKTKIREDELEVRRLLQDHH